MALGLRPSWAALLRRMRRQAVAPSERKEELAAVTVPPWAGQEGGQVRGGDQVRRGGQVREVARLGEVAR